MIPVEIASASDSTEFPVAWEDPQDAALTWTHDRMHFPEPVSPMEFSLIGAAFETVFAAMAQAFDLPLMARLRRINTYYYQTIAPLPLPPEELAAREQRALHRFNRTLGRLSEIWQAVFLSEIGQHLRVWEAFDLSGASLAALAAHWEESVARVRRLWQLHIWITAPTLMAISQFADFYYDLYPDQEEYRPYRLLQSLGNKTLEASQALWQLSRHALALSGVRAALARHPPTAIPAALERFPEGRAFLAELSAYLSEYGQRSDKWDISSPSWIEAPSTVLKSLKEYIAQPERDLEAEIQALAAERERLIAQTRKHLRAYPPRVAEEFERLLGAAQAATMILEDHGFYIDYCVRYRVRRVLLELGRRFVAASLLDRPDDVFYLTVDEVSAMAQAPGAIEIRPRVALRQAEMAHFRTITPPPVLGAPPGEWDSPIMRAIVRFWGVPPAPSAPPILYGHPGARGLARGPARVLRSLAEVTRLQPGDILVTETTAPPWTPLFAIVAAIVTDTGGVLSHAAILAREFGIPAVVGTGQATKLIRDGQMLEVDGSAGLVRIIQ
ncbi:MAG: hypothetical protein C4311_04960 [Chloroflexota bacterium]